MENIYRKIELGERITTDEALRLMEEAPLAELSRLATLCRERTCGDALYYNRNFHIEPTNVCRFNCLFCSYRRPRGSAEAWDYSLDEIEQIALSKRDSGATEVHIVGGVHPDHNLEHYIEMISRVKRALPNATVKAFTAIELAYMIEKAGLDYAEGLRRLREAGMEA
ncbi:MAG: radical SAM protein, partial [Tidjanibacter sp.]|nr:radical SAM protein [Tidjanibacter sp.]